MQQGGEMLVTGIKVLYTLLDTALNIAIIGAWSLYPLSNDDITYLPDTALNVSEANM
jgi:hypothetical protein